MTDEALPGFAPEEFAARRTRVCDAIGDGSLALLQGAPAPTGFRRFRQTNEFHYLTGVEIPHAYVLLDGRTRTSTLYLPSGRGTAEAAGTEKRRSGVERVAGTERLAADLATQLLRTPGLTVHTPLAPAEVAGSTRDTLLLGAAQAASDPWDGAESREARFAQRLKTRFSQIEVRDLSPVLDRLRLVKSPAEVAVMRYAARLTGLAVMDAMRSTRPAVAEYELEALAQLRFRQGGARGEGYCAILPSGAAIWDAHYSANDGILRDGEMVLMDYAPDYRYYTSDIGRMWPVGGTFLPAQRELYGFMERYHQAVLRRIRPGVTAETIHAEAAAEMGGVLAETVFSKPVYAEAARRTLTFDGHLSHPVGMAVHDVGDYRRAALSPGLVIAVDPQMWVPEEQLYVRVEDTVVVTADGMENLTGFVPTRPEDIERLMREPGLLQAYGEAE